MSWSRIAALVLVEIPALIVTVWYRVFVVLMAIICLGTVGILTISLGLWLFGVRWGW